MLPIRDSCSDSAEHCDVVVRVSRVEVLSKILLHYA